MQVTGPALYFLKLLECTRKQPMVELLIFLCRRGFGGKEQELTVTFGVWLPRNSWPVFSDDVILRPGCTVAFSAC